VIEATDCSRPDRTGRSFWYSALGNRTRSFTGSSRSTSPGGSSRHAGRWLSVCCTANYCTVRGRQRWTARRRYDGRRRLRTNQLSHRRRRRRIVSCRRRRIHTTRRPAGRPTTERGDSSQRKCSPAYCHGDYTHRQTASVEWTNIRDESRQSTANSQSVELLTD